MSPRAVVTVAVVCLVVLAGCSAFTGGSNEPSGDETVTPVPLTTEADPTPTPRNDYPPGVFANGTVDIDALVAAHEAQVADRTYSWQFQYAIGYDGDNPFDGNFSRRVSVGQDTLLVEQLSPGISPNQSLYVDETGYLRTVQDGETGYERIDDPGDQFTYAFAEDVIRRYMTDVDVDVSVVERGGQTYYRLYSTDMDIPRTLDMFDANVWNYSATVYVTSEGFVRTMAVEYEREGQGSNQRISARFDYTAMGETTVREPDWVSNVTPTPTASPTTVTEPTATPANATPTARTATSIDDTPTPSNATAVPTEATGTPSNTTAAADDS